LQSHPFEESKQAREREIGETEKVQNEKEGVEKRERRAHMLMVAPRGSKVLAVVSSTIPESMAVRMEIGKVAALEAVEKATIMGCLIA
jgi:hypothetical protein